MDSYRIVGIENTGRNVHRLLLMHMERTDMNLTRFLKQTDVLTAKCSADQLTAFIYDIARTLPEYRREEFLERLRTVGESAHALSEKNAVNNDDFDKCISVSGII